jgi:two-component system chemotaxis sensor kinase CheA
LDDGKMEELSQGELKQLIKLFTEEATEKVSEMEQGLLKLEKEPENKELLNRIFRAAHTIKGTSSSVGFKNISDFSHRIEECLDLLRKGSIRVEKKIIDILLASTDIIKKMLQKVSEGSDFDMRKCDRLLKELEAIKATPQKRLFKIIFSPDPDIIAKGIDPTKILEDIKSFGRCINIKAYTDAIPALSEFNPEKLYLRWDILLETEYGIEEFKRIFGPTLGEDINIIPVSQAEVDVPLMGEVLMKSGTITERDVEEALKAQRKIGDILLDKGKVSKEDLEKALNEQTEKRIDSFRQAVTSTIRVDLRKLDQLLNLVGEMVIIHSMLEGFIDNGQYSWSYNLSNSSHDIQFLFSQLKRIGRQIQESTMSLRMLPVGEVFHRFNRLVRELSLSQNKKVELLITGEDTELDKGVLEKISDSLVHLIRNAIDHGIESPEERLQKGKPEVGTINLSAYQVGDSIYIEIEDDGRGIDKEKIIRKALSIGLLKNSDELTEEQIYNLIFLPGFSTTERVTEVSGRGVGMDVVKKTVESLNGRIYIRTKKDIGTTITIKLPLTLAIIDGLTVRAGEEIYIVPLQSVIELIRINKEEVNTLNEDIEFLHVRGEEIPVIRLKEIMGLNNGEWYTREEIAIVTAHEGRKIALAVDGIIGQQQVVVKNFGGALPKIKGIGGCTILGDGRVALVLDMAGLFETSMTEGAIIT